MASRPQTALSLHELGPWSLEGWRRWLPEVAVLALFVAVVLCLFHPHLAGDLTFPWDFQGGYHAHAVARLRDGSFLSPPLWMPWGGFGIPGHLSLQDGAWYLPLYAYAAVDGYDLVAATRLQVLHVLLGAMGAYAFCRSFAIGRVAACLAGLAYLFSGSFYSNAQHVDIVRGAALVPWLLLGINAFWQRQDAWRFMALVLVLWQYLVAAYPGQVIASGYFCGVMVIALGAASALRREPLLTRSALLGLAVACAVALSSVKFLPALLDPDSVRQSAVPEALADKAIFTTFLFGFDAAFLPNDLTMRDLFVPWALLPFVAYGAKRSLPGVIGVAGVALSLLFIADAAALRAVVTVLPMTDLSRFPLADFRPILHVAIALLAAVGLQRLVGDRGSWWPSARYAGMALAVALLTWIGIRIGHPAMQAVWGWGAFAVAAVITVLLRRRAGSDLSKWLALAVLAVLVGGQGAWHVMAAGRTWRAERTDAQEYATYGNSLHALTSVNRFRAIEYRPERVVYEALPVMHLTELFSPRYQYAWYAEGFSAFGYEAVKSSPTIERLYSLALYNASPAQRQTLDWLLRRSSIYLLPHLRALDAKEISSCQTHTCAAPGVAQDVVLEAFRENGAVFRVATAHPFTMVENEVLYPGWTSLICAASGCRAGPDAVAVNGVLRTWNLPAGSYRLITYYRPPAWSWAVALAWLGALIAVIITAKLFVLRLPTNKSVQREE